MQVTVDLTLCMGHGQCENAAPTVFHVSDEGLVELLQPTPPDELYPLVEDAVRLCPVEAISVAR